MRFKKLLKGFDNAYDWKFFTVTTAWKSKGRFNIFLNDRVHFADLKEIPTPSKSEQKRTLFISAIALSCLR